MERDLVSSSENQGGAQIVVAELIGGNPIEEPRMSVLVVDGNLSARDSVLKALNDYYTLRFVGGADEAIASVRTSPPDLIVTELDLSDGDGLTLCARLRDAPETEHLPIMVLTTRATPQDKVAGFLAGADDYVVKPLDMRLFYARIRLLCRIKGLEHPRSLND